MKDRDNCRKIYDNGICHIEIAKELAAKKIFGFAISHLVLGLEEFIKYQVILNHLADNSLFQTKEIETSYNTSVFRSHKTKHRLIDEFQNSLSLEFSTTFIESIFKRATSEEFDNKYTHIINNRFKESGNFLSTCYNDINLSEDERNEFVQWFDTVKNKSLKDRGFYVNWQNNNWESPSDLTVEEYKKGLKYAMAFQKLTEIIKDLDFNDEEFNQFLNSEA